MGVLVLVGVHICKRKNKSRKENLPSTEKLKTGGEPSVRLSCRFKSTRAAREQTWPSGIPVAAAQPSNSHTGW